MATELEHILRIRFPNSDIRTDQCDMIRILSNTMAAGCTEKKGAYHATIISLLDVDLDYENELIAEIQESTPEMLAERLAEFF